MSYALGKAVDWSCTPGLIGFVGPQIFPKMLRGKKISETITANTCANYEAYNWFCLRNLSDASNVFSKAHEWKRKTTDLSLSKTEKCVISQQQWLTFISVQLNSTINNHHNVKFLSVLFKLDIFCSKVKLEITRGMLMVERDLLSAHKLIFYNTIHLFTNSLYIIIQI